jgi:hypothetical protein
MRKPIFVVALLAIVFGLPARADMASGMTALKSKNYAEAMAQFEPEAQAGNPIAQNLMGMMYMTGLGVTVDDAAALSWFQKSATQGYAVAQTNAGFMFEQGRGTRRDLDQARAWYQKAANQGDPRGRLFLNNLDWKTARLTAMQNGNSVSSTDSAAPKFGLSSPLPQLQNSVQATRSSTQSAPVSARVDQPVHCLQLTDVRASMPPDVLYRMVGSCVEQGDFASAARLFSLAGIFSRFDGERVADKTGRDAGAVMILNTFNPLPQETREKFGERFNAMVQDPEAMRMLCADIQRVGPPTYYPEYMVAHGIGGAATPLIAGFDAKRTWTSFLASYLHCTAQ